MNIAGLLALTAGVQAFFQAQGLTATVAFGWKARSQQLNQGPGGASRVVFMPGRVPPDSDAPKSIDAGEILQPRMPTANKDNPRALRQWKQLVTLSVWGVAGDGYTGGLGLGDEASQYAATIDLFEATLQAIQGAVWLDHAGERHSVGLADVVLEQASWVQPPVEMGFGRELYVVFTHRGPLYDLPRAIATPQPAVNRGTFTD